MKRVSDMLMYGITAAALLGGVGYGWRQLTSPPPIPPVPPLNEAAAQLPPIPEPAAAPPAPTASVVARFQPQPDPAIAQAAEDRQTFQDLRRNCYDAAASNSNGEYPALQAAACDRFAQFAGERGWYTGALPGYAQPAPPPQPVTAQPYASWDQNSSPPQVGYVIPGYDLGVPHHRPVRPPQENEQPQGQIGPNYAPPPLQQPPPVSQHHSPTQSRPASPARH